MTLPDLRPIEFHQLCAIARTVLEASPTIDDAEWKARTKEKAAKQGYDEAPTEMLANALTQVEYALVRTLGPRPIDLPATPAGPVPPQQDDPPWRHPATMSAGWASIADLIANLQGYVNSGRPSAAPPAVACEALPISEQEALNVFWHEAGPVGANRLGVLRAFAEVAIVRPAGWSTETIRAKADQHHLTADQCFGCFSADRARAWHHVIQVQHGGSNTPRNRVSLCGPCHSEIHPWLPGELRIGPGWSSLGDLAAAYAGAPPKKARSLGFATMRTWQIATRDTGCGFDHEHVIAKGEWFLEIETESRIKRRRCQACAAGRFDATPPSTHPPEATNAVLCNRPVREPLVPIVHGDCEAATTESET